MQETYRLFGDAGSPYSMKMRALLRYRRIPFVWIQVDPQTREEIAHVRPPVIPVLQYPGDGSYHVDSTPMAYELEARHPGRRSVVPEDPGLAFLSHLIEDMADEWLTKAMFHYRWWREEDQSYCSTWLRSVQLAPCAPEEIALAARDFRDRQVGRLALVGCTDVTRPVIEESYRRVLAILERSLGTARYLFGSRPALADFGLFGQLYQLGHDPTPQSIMRREAPGVAAWLSRLDDASGDEEGNWLEPGEPLPVGVVEFLRLTGEIYLPFLAANARAAQAGQESFSLTLLGRPYEQGTFKYQVKCLRWLREERERLGGDAKERVDAALRETGCLDFFR